MRQEKMSREKKEKVFAFLNRYSLVFHAFLACMICFYIETISRHSVGKAFTFLFDRSWVFLYNSSIIFASFLLVYLFRRRTFVRILFTGLWVFLGTINGCILLKRVTPFGYTDLKLVQDLFAMQNNYFTLREEILVIALVALFVLFLVWMFIKGPKYRGKMHYGTHTLLLASCFVWIPMCTNAAVNSNLLSNYFENIALGYEDYGFVYGFSTSVVDRGMRKPEGYSEEAVAAVQENVEKNGKSTNVKTEDQPNIVLVLLESFMDPEEIKFLNYSEDPVPNFRRLSKEFTSGYLKVPVVGAGTANTEFEMLTGMNLKFFGTGEYPYKTILKDQDCESIASDLKALGYGSHVVHNNGGNFYSRANAFSKMGFDTFTSKEMMNIQEYTPLGTWPTDHILLSEVEKAMDATPGQSDFVYTITVQSHGDYPTEKVIENPEIQVAGAESEEKNNQWEYYVNEVHKVDRFIGDLVNQLSKRDEKTVLVLFGDHLPTMGLEDTDMKSGDIFLTRYATWNNFGMDKADEKVTSYQLMSKITEEIGIHEGTILKYHQTESAQKNEEAYLSGLEMLQYDLLYGKRYAYQGEDRYPASDLEMGVQDVVIRKVEIVQHAELPEEAGEDGAAETSPLPAETQEPAEEELSSFAVITGENFTPWSRVYVNGEKVKTTQISGTRLEIPAEELEEGDTIVVNQLGSKSTIFRSSNEVTYRSGSSMGYGTSYYLP